MEMVSEGITKEQKEGYTLGVNDLLYRSIWPYGGESYYTKGNDKVTNIKGAMHTARDSIRNIVEGRDESNFEKEDAWRLYLGLPQKKNTFGISDYQPSISKQTKYYFKFNNPLNEMPELSDMKRLVSLIKNGYVDEFSPTTKPQPYTGMGNVMGNFKWSLGKDEKGCYVSYYDLWKLDVPLEKGKGFFGKPFEIYDRIYYNPETYEIVK